MQKVMENLYVFQDTCNVYVFRNGRKAVLVDFGSGKVLDCLHTIGVDEITDILMTHHHRDQGQGLARATEAGIRIWVPHTEQDLFQHVNEHWQAREIYNNYNVRQDRFSILESVEIAGTLRDYATYQFDATAITVFPTPGHTVGSVTLLTHWEGRNVAFTGDLITAPGKVWSMSALQWTYNGAEGVAASILSLLDVKERCPNMLLPSHGEPIDQPVPAIDLLVDRLQRLLKLQNRLNQDLLELRDHPYEQITPHLLKNRTCTANSYVLLSKSGNALIIDYGYDFNIGLAAGTDRSSRRPWLYTIDALKRDYGVKKIDVVLPTHFHDDHVAGLNLLRDVEGAEIWVADNFSDLLERPSHYDLPCLWYDPIPVDRKLPLERSISWGEYEFTLYEQSGHTLYAVAISFKVDGKQVLTIGDQQDNNGDLWNYVYKNQFRMRDYKDSAQLYSKIQPDLILSGHWDPLWIKSGYLEKLQTNGETLETLHRELLPLDHIDLGAEGFCAWIRPYQLTASGGEFITLDVEVLNPRQEEAEITVRLIAPAEWKLEKEEISILLLPQARHIMKFQIQLPVGKQVRRARVAVDVSAGNLNLGQQAEALITVV